MGNYRIPKEVSSELKINKALYLTDLALLIGILLLTFTLSGVIYQPLTWFFYGFMAIVAGLLIIRPATNPKKRMYQAIYFAIRKRKDVYVPVDYVAEEENEAQEE